MPKHVVVVGAGIAGLAAGVALQRRGVEVTVLEERMDAASGAAISIWPNALAALDRMGLGDAVRAASGRVTAGAVRWRTGAWLRRPNRDRMVKALGEPLVVIRRAMLTDILSTGLRPDSVRHGVAVHDLSATPNGVRLRVSGGADIEADAVVGADGIRSLVARYLNGPFTHRYAGYTAWRGVSTCRIDPDLAGGTMGPGVEFGHLPMGDRHTYWFVTERAPEGAKTPEGELTYLTRKYSTWAAPVPELLATTDPAILMRHDIYDRTQAQTWARGPVVLVGDAAHPMRPHLGQGGCQGLEDAVILAAFVGGDDDLAAAFARFADYRRPRVERVVRGSALMGRAFNLRPALLAAAASRATALVPDALVTRQLATIASRDAFATPPDRDVAPA